MPEAVIVSAARTAMGKGKKGTLKTARPDDMAAACIHEAVARAPGLEPRMVDDVIVGCAIPEAEQGMNVARMALLKAGLPVEVPGMTINRFCASGLQSIALAAERIRGGGAEVIVAGGTETMSRVAMFGRAYPNPEFAGHWPDIYLGMGLTAENLAVRYGIGREEADRFALESNRKASAAIQEGKFAKEIVPFRFSRGVPGKNGQVIREEVEFKIDECPRPDTTLEGLAKLKPVFKLNGTVTAGNASQMADGAAMVVVMSDRRAQAMGLKPLAVFRTYAVAGVPPEIMGIGPVKAIPRALEMAGLKMDDMDIIELNEAFAVQALSVLKELNLPRERINVNGGAVALGHPLGATGARLTVSALVELERRRGKYAMITMCIGGGMGAAGIIERI
ncbi:MAG: thiolase family protein [Planctomycetes bacterium]|nr:thiolase family protein [Planctomycetota bacterium]